MDTANGADWVSVNILDRNKTANNWSFNVEDGKAGSGMEVNVRDFWPLLSLVWMWHNWLTALIPIWSSLVWLYNFPKVYLIV